MFGKKGHLKPAWSYKASGVLWRLVPAAGGILIGEVRDVDRKRTSFLALNERSGKPLWRDKTFGEDWWIGIEAVGHSVLFLHLFATPDLPEHRGIIAVDTGSGELLWSDPGLKFEWLDGDLVTASRSTAAEREILRVDGRTGTMMQAEAMSRGSSAERGDVVAPLPIAGISGAGNPAAVLLRSSVQRPLLGNVAEYINHTDYIVFCYVSGSAAEARENSRQYISIVERENGVVVYDAMVQENLSALMPGNFFVAGGLLLYVRGRSELVAVPLQHIPSESTER